MSAGKHGTCYNANVIVRSTWPTSTEELKGIYLITVEFLTLRI